MSVQFALWCSYDGVFEDAMKETEEWMRALKAGCRMGYGSWDSWAGRWVESSSGTAILRPAS